MVSFGVKMLKQHVFSVQINTFFKGLATASFKRSHKTCMSIGRLVEFFGFKSEDFVAVNASGQNYLKAVQYVEACLNVVPLFCVVTSSLTDRYQSILCHSPFPQSVWNRR
jgi:hypothetical protein